MIDPIPLPYRILAGVLLGLALCAAGFAAGAKVTGDHWRAKVAASERKTARIQQKQGEATVKVVTEYVDRIKVVHEKGDTIIKEVHTYVTPEADAHCIVPRGFVRLHDAAAANQIPGPAGTSDAAPSGIALSTTAGTIAINYERCAGNAEQLRGLQEWVRAQEMATNE